MKGDYASQFKDPRWQKFRLKVLEKDGFKCTSCGDGESMLHAHHLYYISKRKPWEYPIDSVLTLCDSCHDGEHEDPSEPKEWERLLMIVPRVPSRHEITSAIGMNFRDHGALSVDELTGAIAWSVELDGDYWAEIVAAYRDMENCRKGNKSKNQ